MGWTNEMAFAKVLCSRARPASADDALAVLEPFAVKVAWAVLWGGGGSDAVSLPANRRACAAQPANVYYLDCGNDTDLVRS
jgi:hypothetical protein